jgi:hypothetical protein
MKLLVNKLLAGLAGLAIATSVPMAASAQTWHDNGNHTVYRADRRGDVRYERRHADERYTVRYAYPVYHRPYVNGYFGWAPAGFQGYFWNGRWYHHRRWNSGVWLYF